MKNFSSRFFYKKNFRFVFQLTNSEQFENTENNENSEKNENFDPQEYAKNKKNLIDTLKEKPLKEKLDYIISTFSTNSILEKQAKDLKDDDPVDNPDFETAEKLLRTIKADVLLNLLEPETLNSLFLKNIGNNEFQVNFHEQGCEKTPFTDNIGAGDLFPHNVQYLKINGEVGKRSLYRPWGKVGYLAGEDYLEILGDEIISFPTQEEINAFEESNTNIQTLSEEEEKEYQKEFAMTIKMAETFESSLKEFSLSSETREKSIQNGLEKIEDNLNISPHMVSAIMQCETQNNNFGAIRFERHVFIKRLMSKKSELKNDYGSFDKIPQDALNEAKDFAMKESTSWGAFQIMGYHYEKLTNQNNQQYKNVQEMISEMSDPQSGIENQFRLFGQFISLTPHLKNAMQENPPNNETFHTIARFYNGPMYDKHNPPYNEKLKDFYNKIKNHGGFVNFLGNLPNS